jgi:hypothetical protein
MSDQNAFYHWILSTGTFIIQHNMSGHERLFKRMHDKAFEQYADMPWGG